MKIKFEGKKPTLSAMKDMSHTMRSIRRHGNMSTENRYFVYEGDKLRAAQPTKKSAMKYMKMGRTIFSIMR